MCAVLLSVVSCSMPELTYSPVQGEVQARGIYRPGNNITEPRPMAGKYLKVTDGGVLVLREVAGLYVNARVIQKPESDLFITIDYEDPRSGTISNTMVFDKEAVGFGFSSPRFQSGLIPYRNYMVVIKVWNNNRQESLLDTIRQPVRSYVDTRGDKALVLDRMTS